MKRKMLFSPLSYALVLALLLGFSLVGPSSLSADSSSCTTAYDAAYSSCQAQSNGSCADECQCILQAEVAECACIYGTHTQAFRQCRRDAFQRIVACDLGCP